MLLLCRSSTYFMQSETKLCILYYTKKGLGSITHMLLLAELSRPSLMLSIKEPRVPSFLRAVAVVREASCPP
jgi:hypothetical protein